MSYIAAMRIRLLATSLLLLAAACGGTDAAPGSPATTEAPATTAAGSASTSAPSATTDPTASEGPQSVTDGPAAPALSTVLADGTEFSLASEAKPVYLIFWAEW